MSPDTEVEVAFAVLSVIEKAIQAWRDAKDGKIKPEQVVQHASDFIRSLNANDAAIDAAAKAKFQDKP